MKSNRTAHQADLSTIPNEFRENYLFLCELINCEAQNTSIGRILNRLSEASLADLKGRLNRRQAKIIKDYVFQIEDAEGEEPAPPVPAELEASIRIRDRSTWLPWEAEAIRKINRWRQDIECINGHLAAACGFSRTATKTTKTGRRK
jgi:hypothetical protein